MIFSTRENLLSLYNAVNHSHYTDPTELEIVTLKNAVYMNMKNDQAFLLDMQLNLYEHQSTWNPNMPLRFLIYVAKEFQMLIRDRTLYASTLVELPTPHFVVFYNGEEDRAAESELRLSHSFKQKTDTPELELIVKVLNINPDKQQAVLDACKLLKEYMLLVNKIRKYTAGDGDINMAVEQAVTECRYEFVCKTFRIEKIFIIRVVLLRVTDNAEAVIGFENVFNGAERVRFLIKKLELVLVGQFADKGRKRVAYITRAGNGNGELFVFRKIAAEHVFHGVNLFKYTFRVFQKLLAAGSYLYAAGRTLEEIHSERGFQILYATAEVGLVHIQRFGRLVDRSAGRHFNRVFHIN